MLAFRLIFFLHSPFQFIPRWNGWLMTWSSHPLGNKPPCSLPCPVGWEQVYSWWAADSDKQPVLHVIHLLLHQSIISRSLLNCLLNIVSTFCRYARCTRSVSIGKPSLRTLLQSLVYSGNPLRCKSIKQIVDLCLIACSAPGILCSSGSLPSSLLHGARYLWQWVNGEWRSWPSTRWCTQHQRGGECCGQAPTRSQGKREACHVLLLRRWGCLHQGISWSIPCICTVSVMLSDTEFMH